MTLFFYDLETSGFNPRRDRIMQFAGQRTDMDLKPIGEPLNVLITLSEDVLPSPDAILVTGITPQKTKTDGITEADFLKIFHDEIATPGTIFVGYNTVRFDDEFMRFLQYRNFYDAYEWQWKDNRGRWDLLDVVRMTRALRPDGIKWPMSPEGKPSNRLELLTSINKLEHSNAHDALSDVLATIDLAKLIKSKQPQLFEFLLSVRHKRDVADLVNCGQPFVYTSGKYPGEFDHTSVAIKIADNPKKQGALVYDLRVDPAPFIKMDPAQLADAWKYKKDSDEPRLPVKTLQYNRCPVIAPMGVLDEKSQKRLKLDLKTIKKNISALSDSKEFVRNILKAVEILDKQQQETLLANENQVDAQLYDGFIPESDKTRMFKVRSLSAEDLSEFDDSFSDNRLQALLPLYKARNYPKSLSDSERTAWEDFKKNKLFGGSEPSIKAYFERIQELTEQPGLSKEKQFLLEELRLYGESIMPETY